MRKARSVLLLGLAVPALSALPVLGTAAPAQKPVAPEVQQVAVRGVDPQSLHSADGSLSRQASVAARSEVVDPAERGRAPSQPAVLTAERTAKSFELLGVTWAAGSTADVTVVVRTHSDHGWTGWTALDPAATPGRADGTLERAGTEPLWTGPSDGYQVRIDVRSGALPADVRVDLVDPGDSRADGAVGQRAPAATAAAATGQPRIFSRAEWGADESLRGSGPRYSSTIKAGFVHHTAGANGYSEAEVPKILRAVYAYHTKANGWSDIGYNFLVDRFGRVWEGRYGGITRPVLGAHTGGFNTDTFGVSAIGDYGKVDAPPEMVDAIARVMAWKLSLHFRDPFGTTTLVSEGGGTSRYARGTAVNVNVISGHRDMGKTSCPGGYLYAQLATIRAKVHQYIGASLVNPAAVPPSQAYGAGPIDFRTGALREQSLLLEIRERCGGRLVRTLTGSVAPGAPTTLTWDLLRSDGSRARPGDYDVSLAGSSAGEAVRTWTSTVNVAASDASAAAGDLPVPCDSSFVPLRPTRLHDTRSSRAPLGPGGQLDVTVAGRAGIPASGAVAVALNVTAVRPTRSTFLTVFPAGGTRPNASSLNLPAGATRAGFVVAAVGLDGKVGIANHAGTTHVVVDVAGYYVFPAGSGQLYHPAQPFRLYDSRTDPAGMLANNGARTMTLPVLDGVDPSQMGGAVLNVTAVGAAGSGYLTVHPAGTARPLASTLNFQSAGAVANRAAVRLTGGALTVTNRGSASHVVVDVVGWYAAPTVTGGRHFRAMAPLRALDTRTGRGGPRGAMGPDGVIALWVAGAGRAVPADAAAVVMTLTSTGASATTYLSTWPGGTARPAASDLNVRRGQTTANLVVVPVGADGTVNVYNRFGTTHVVADVVGYYR
jgi:hypothetical protein